ncbi:MAG: NAD-dependent epimerase/dehydratase family protein [Gammaproteobacteria bacterium]|nr:MAG: NAD-dependent epimerase/dehydratase family protein [Gammaproteobacteria bacterium]
MEVLITGGAGFIGSHFVGALIARGDKVRVLDNLSTGKLSNIEEYASAITFLEGDIRDGKLTDECVRGCDAVVHLAAVASVQASVDDPLGTHGSNFDGTLNLLEGCRKHGVARFIYASSAAVYGDTETIPVAETASLNPLTPYAVDKLSGEYYLSYFNRQYDLNTTAFRFFNIYGPRQDPSSPYSGVISIFVHRALSNQGVTIFGDGGQTRDFVYVGDLAAMLVASLDREDMGGAVINLGRGRQTSLLELLTALESLTGNTIAREFLQARAGDIRHSCADIVRLKKYFDKVPETDIEQGLSSLLKSIS